MDTKRIQIIGGFPKPDYNQSDENHIGYIQNRPFYDERVEETFTATFDGDKSDDTVVASYGSDYVLVSENTIEDASIIDSASVNVIINGAEETMDIPNSMWQDVSGMLSGAPALGAVYDEDNQICLVVSLQQNMGQYPKGIYVLANDDLCVMSFTYTTKQGELKQIDSKFIPPLPRTHIRYSAYADGTDFTEEWSTGQNYIGYAEAVEAPTDKADYQWSLFASNIRDTLSITLAADAWTNKQQTITTAMIGDDSTVFASPNPSSNDAYAEAGVVLSGATSQSLTFACEVVPAVDIDVEVYVSNPLVIAGVQADYEQNDSTQADYIKNKPFGDESVMIGDTLTWDGKPTDVSVEVVVGGGQATCNLVSDNIPTFDDLNGGTFRLFINSAGDVDYSYSTDPDDLMQLVQLDENVVGVCAVDDSDFAPYIVVCNVDNYSLNFGGKTFLIPRKGVYFAEIEMDQLNVRVSSLTAPNYTFTKTEIKKLDPKYLPEGGVGYEGVTDIGDTLTWDGTPTDTSVGLTDISLERVSDSTPSVEELVGGSFVMSIIFNSTDGETNVNDSVEIELTSDNVLQANENFIVLLNAGQPNVGIALEDGAIFEVEAVKITFPKKGIYFIRSEDDEWDGIEGYYLFYISSLTIPNYNFTKTEVHKIDKKFLPEICSTPYISITVTEDGLSDADQEKMTVASASEMPILAKVNNGDTTATVLLTRVMNESGIYYSAYLNDSLFSIFYIAGQWGVLQESNSDINSDITALKSRVSTVEGQCEDFEGRISELESGSDDSDLRPRVDTLETDVSSLTTRVDELAGMIPDTGGIEVRLGDLEAMNHLPNINIDDDGKFLRVSGNMYVLEDSSFILGTSGTVTLSVASWVDGVTEEHFDALGNNDAIFFTPSTRADKTALEAANVFIETEGQTVTFEAETTPTVDIALNFFITRGE